MSGVTTRGWRWVGPVVLVAASAAAVAQTEGKRAPVALTRADVALAYTRLERSLEASPPAAGEIAGVHADFDQLTFKFFRGEVGPAVAAVHALDDRVRGAEPTDEERVARSLRVELSPRVWVAGSREPVSVRVTSMYAVAREGRAVAWSLRLRREDGTGSAVDWPISGEAVAGALVDSEGVVNEASQLPARAGRYSVRVIAGDLGSAVIGTLQVVERSLSGRREAARRALAGLRERAELADAVAAAESRALLLDDEPSQDNSAQFLVDLDALAGEVEGEVLALTRGEDPYRRRVGDYWRGVPVGPGVVMPARVFAPAAVRTEPDTPRALVIALHGAGGDENMFMDAYGAGLIKRLGEGAGFIVVSPRTETMATVPGAFDALVKTMTGQYAIDPARVYVVGHSLGAVIGATLARAHADAVAGAACLAGGPRGTFVPPCAPMLVIGAERDIVMAPAGLKGAVAGVKAAGVDVTYREKPWMGHTLMVRDTLPEAVEWLLARRLGGAVGAGAGGGKP